MKSLVGHVRDRSLVGIDVSIFAIEEAVCDFPDVKEMPILSVVKFFCDRRPAVGGEKSLLVQMTMKSGE